YLYTLSLHDALPISLCDRELDAAASIAAALPLKQTLDAGFDEGSRDFWLGLVARLKGDSVAARAAFTRVRADLDEAMRVHPDDIPATEMMHLLSHFGLIDA